jgi:hypothetical protein
LTKKKINEDEIKTKSKPHKSLKIIIKIKIERTRPNWKEREVEGLIWEITTHGANTK